LAVASVVGMAAYAILPRGTTVVRIDQVTCGPTPLPVNDGTALSYLSCAWGAFGLAFLLPHRWAWLWPRVPRSLAGIVLAVPCATTA
jgi:hypothetical protein